MKKLLLTIILILIVIIGYFIIQKNTPKTPVQTITIPTGRVSYTGNGVQFSYPQMFSGNVWRPINWPPVVHIIPLTQDPVVIGCPDMQNVAQQSGTIQGKTASGLPYSLYQGSDVGAGQLYLLYCYVVQGKSDYYVFDITIHATNGCWWGNCGPYCGTEHEQECKDFDLTKEVIAPIEKIISTVNITQ